MHKLFLTLTLTLLCASSALAQARNNAGARSETNLGLQSGTEIAGQLQHTLDVRRAKIGDQVVLRTTEAVKANGRTVVQKGARLIGHVTDVRPKAGARGESSVSILFDRLESGSLRVPVAATITSVTQAPHRARREDGELSTDSRAQSSTSTRATAQRSGGGLLGGVTNTVGGVVGGATAATGEVVGNTTDVVGGTVNKAATGLGTIRVTQSADARAEGGSTLSLTGENLRLDKGATFRLTLQQSARVGSDEEN